MGLFDAFQDHHDDVHHRGNLTHDALAGAVAFEAIKSWEDHQAKNGKPDNHALAKELLGGFAAAAITRLAETKGLDAWDDHKRKQLEEKAHGHLEETILVKEYAD